MQRHSYLTRRAYGNHPIGSKCFAFRVDCGRRLILEFLDGDIVELPGNYYAEGVDKKLIIDSMEDDFISLFTEKVKESEDDEFFISINEIIKEFKHDFPNQ